MIVRAQEYIEECYIFEKTFLMFLSPVAFGWLKAQRFCLCYDQVHNQVNTPNYFILTEIRNEFFDLTG